MPLNVVICNPSKKLLLQISNAVQKIAAKKQYDARVKYICLTPEKILDDMNDLPGRHLFIIEAARDKADIYKEIRKVFRDSYLCFTIEDDTDLIKYIVNLNLMPSGLLVKPPDVYEAASIIGCVYSDYLNSTDDQSEYLSVNIGFDIYKIPLSDILYFEAFSKKIEIHTKGRCISYYASLQQLEEKLEGRFVRCHKSYLVNATKIHNIIFSDMCVILDNGEKISISRTYKNQVKALLNT